MRRVVLLLVTAVLLTVQLEAQERTRIDVSKLGPQVGDRVPDFTLNDQTGTARTLKSIMGRRGAMLVFVRSADWCPYCKTQLVELQGRAIELQEQGFGVVSISYDSREVLAAFTKQHGITFPMLSDPGSETIKRYGILNTVVAQAFGPNRDDPEVKAEVLRYISVVNPSPNMEGIPFPGMFVVNTQGRVTSRVFEDFYVERSTVSSIMKKLGVGANIVAGTKVSTEHLDVTTFPTNDVIAAGNRFSLVLDVTPRRGMHVYAPGASGYRVITATIAPQSFVRLSSLSYPASETYHFTPLNERVPVYQKPFSLVQDVVLDGDLKTQAALRGQESLTINGTLEYQACDDKICYNPVSVPLSWTVKLRPLVMQRPSAAPRESR